MKFTTHRLVWAFLALTLLCASPGYAQFKKIYVPDTSTLQLPNFLKVVNVLETDLPGKELVLVGSMNTMDSANVPRSEMFHLFCDVHGEPQVLHMYEDTSAFVFQPPQAYAACYDGNGILYTGIGANNRQVVFKSDANGQLLWSMAGHHHEYYSMVCEGGSVTFLGQDESQLGVHDFSLGTLDAAGTGGAGNMYGTPNFEIPQRMLKIDNQYVAVGSSYINPTFEGMIVKADASLELLWGHLYQMNNRSVQLMGIARPRDGHGYIVSGRMRGGADSLLLMKIDTVGNPIWTKFYGISGASEVYNYAIAVDPVSGGYLLAGNYRGTQYFRPYIFMTDSVGNVRWARDYGEPGVQSDETLRDIIYHNATGKFYAAGDMVAIDSNQYLLKVLLVMVDADSGSVPCDSAISVGAASRVLTAHGTIVEEPFLAAQHFPIGNMFASAMVAETRCSVIVGLAENVPLQGEFRIVNPSAAELKVQADVFEGGAELRVSALTGETVMTVQVPEGHLQEAYALPQLSSGMYLVSLRGTDWRYPTLRWVVQR